MMTVPEILKELEPYTGRFPMAAMQAAVDQREAITPELLRVVESVADNPEQFARNPDYMACHFAVYLLAQFREKRAYRALVKMMSAPGEIPFDLLGDTITESLQRILASVYDGDPAPLQNLVESEQVNEFVRSAALDTFVVLVNTGQMSRESVVEYLRSLFHGRLQPSQAYVWAGLVGAVADLPAPELMDEVRKAFADDLVEPGFGTIEDIKREVSSPVPSYKLERQTIITDAIGEMRGWAAFNPEPRRRKRPSRRWGGIPALNLAAEPVASNAEPSRSDASGQFYVRETKIGRNEPCPCGSGKKYKKCCGR